MPNKTDLLVAQTELAYYEQGLALKQAGQYDDAIKAFKNAIQKDRKYSEAYYELGKAYTEKNSPTTLYMADDVFRYAVRFAENDLQKSKYYTGWGDLSLARNFKYFAGRYYKKAIELDEKNIEARIGIVQMNREDIVEMQTKSRAVKTFIDGIFVEAVTYIDEALSIDPDFAEALMFKGMLYFDRIPVSRINSRFAIITRDSIVVNPIDEFVKIFEEYTERFPDDPDGFLSLGLGYLNTQDYEIAGQNFSQAKSLLSPEENTQYDDTGILKVGGLFGENQPDDKEDAEKFWYRRDPMYMTDINEREIEHYSRVAEAKLRFSDPFRKIDGAETIRGKILIKYGRPNGESGRGASLGGGAWSVHAFYTNWWFYDGFEFKFERGLNQRDPYRFGVVAGLVNYKEEAIRLEKRLPESYTYISKGRFIDFTYDFATFRGISGATYLELYYAVPVNRLVFESRQNMMVGEYKTGIFLHDSLWNKSLEDINSKTAAISPANFDANSDEVFVGKYDFQVMPNNYFLSFEMMDLNSDNSGAYKDTLKIEEYGFDRLQMSDIQLAWNIEMIDINKQPGRNNLVISPNPRRLYRTDQPVFLYYEIYNLDLTGVNGNNDYTLEYSLEFMDIEPVSVTGLLKNIFRNNARQGLATVYSTKSNRRDEPVFLQIDHNITEPGPYRLTIKVTDNLSNRIVEKSTVLRIIGENK